MEKPKNVSEPLYDVVWERLPRPQVIGLALAGGAARGFAHVGVLEVLDEHHIPIHRIAGTSAGSLVGGLYAAGVSGRRMRGMVQDFSWMKISSLSVGSLNLTKLKLSSLGLPLGFLNMDKMIDFINGVLGGPVRFDQLNVPFAAVATDITHGQMVVLNTGEIAPAIRTSCSVPGIFTPVRRGGRMLVDGVAVANLPTSVVRQMGADYVIAVDLIPPSGEHQKEPANVVELTMMTLYSFIRATQNTNDFAECVIMPDIGHIGLVDMNSIEELIELGRKATEAAIPQIKKDLGLDQPEDSLVI